MTEQPVRQERKPLLTSDRKVILRDLVIFQIKLLLDGIKDIVLVPVSIAAAGFDLILPTGRRGARFYAVMTAGEKFDNWLNLFGASAQAASNTEGLFGASRAGADSLLGRIEEIVLGHEEAEDPTSRSESPPDTGPGVGPEPRSAESRSASSRSA